MEFFYIPMDEQKFLDTFKGNKRGYFAVDYALKQKDWFDYNVFFDAICNDAISRRTSGKSKGKPSDTRKCILYLIKIGFLEVNPEKGLRVDKNFVPVSQK